MDDSSLLVIILALIVGYMCSGMIRNMCGKQLVEGLDYRKEIGCGKRLQCGYGCGYTLVDKVLGIDMYRCKKCAKGFLRVLKEHIRIIAVNLLV